MKKLILISSILVAIFFISCDRIKTPIVKKNTIVGTNFKTKNNFAVSHYKKTLFEEFTGAQCPNCPNGTIIAKNLGATHGSSLVIIAIHAGGFAKPYGEFTDDYRTDAGDKLQGSSGFGIGTYPSAVINRKAYPPSGVMAFSSAWTSIVPTAKNDPFIVKLDVTTNYDTINGALNTDVKAIFQTAYNDNLNACIYLIEEGIEGKQDDMGVVIEEYEFEHMFRGAVNSVWGEALTSSPKAAGDTVKYSYNNFNVKGMTYTIIKTPPAVNEVKPIVVNDKNLYAVVFVCNATTRHVLQVEKIKIW